MARNESYADFVEKFKPKKTTDDCYTPALVYEAVKEWALKRYGLEGQTVMRPFYPGEDYQAESYPSDCVVIDNPPFSILSPICRFYLARGVKFFLFAPTLTLFSACAGACNYLPIAVKVTYDNGACVNTSFMTNLGEYKIDTAPDLYQAVRAANSEVQRQGKKPPPPAYAYPDNVIAMTTVNRCAANGADVKIRDAHFIRALDSQKAFGKTIYGAGFFISDYDARRMAAAKAAAAKAAAAKQKPVLREVIRWELSAREREIIHGLRSE